MDKPVPFEHSQDLNASATQFWIKNDNGTYYLEWHGQGWVVRFQESFMMGDGSFEHYSDIPSFAHSRHFRPEDSDFIFATKEEALDVFNKKDEPKEILADIIEEDGKYVAKFSNKTLPVVERQHGELSELVGKTVSVRIVQYIMLPTGEGEKLFEVPSFANKVTAEVVKEEVEIL